jgi:hypothetical protein
MIWEELQGELEALQRDGLRRQRRTLELPCGPQARVDGRELISFCSNDYLGLANDPALIEAACAGARAWGVGSGASHLVSGHLTPHAALEEKLAAFTGFPRALLFSTGYLANLAIVPALVGRRDAVFADRLNHASLIDAVQLSRADSQRYPHGDLAALERLLTASPARRKLILTDAVFSMDGDLAPLPGLLRARRALRRLAGGRRCAWFRRPRRARARQPRALRAAGGPAPGPTWARSARRLALPAPSSPATRRSSSGCNNAPAPTSSPPPAARSSPARWPPAST